MDWDRSRPITSDFEDLLRHLGARSFDRDGDTYKRPDYSLFNRRLLVEIKTLCSPASGRAQKPADLLQDEILHQKKKTLFLGKVGAEALIRAHDKPNMAREKLLRAASKSAIDHLRKAARQFSTFLASNPLNYGHSTNMVVLINEGFQEYSPELMVRELDREVSNSRLQQSPRYGLLDVVLYISMYHLDARDERQIVNIPVIVFSMRPQDQERALAYAKVISSNWARHIGLIYGGVGADPGGLATLPIGEWVPR